MTSIAETPTKTTVIPTQGIIPPLVTPLKGPDELDVPGLERLVEHVLAGGVHGLFVLGTTGEGPALSYRLRRDLVRRVCRQVRGRVPVLVGVTDSATAEAAVLARFAADEGAAAAVIAPPFYFTPSQAELASFFDRAARDYPLPMVVYNIPGLTKAVIEPDTIRRLRDNDRVVAVKDSSGDMDYFARVVEVARERPDWPVFIGPEHLLADAVALGGAGGVSGGANVVPRLFVDLHDAARAGDAGRVADLKGRAERLGRMYDLGYGSMGVVRALKYALTELGICNDLPAEPFQPLDAAGKNRVRPVLQELRTGGFGY